jgi:hypothetical protein
MNSPRTYFRLISIFCALSLFAVQPGFAATKSVIKLKSAGRTANSIPNTILNGINAPTKSIGINGDFYIDTKNANIYGPKKNNAWPLPISLRGTAGTAGTDGKTGTPGVAGSDGKTVTNTSTVAGTAGATGSTGATGLTGAAGSNGTAGETGAAGASGSAGPAGPPGPAGSTGATGAAGATGSAGTSGVTTVAIGAFSFINTLTGTAGSSAQSANFGSLLPGKKYSMRLNISGSKTSYGDLDTTLILEVISTAGSIPITTGYSVSSGKKFISPSTIYSQNIIADLIIDGTLVTNPFNIFVKVSASEPISYVVSLIGYYALTEVGSIS